MATFNAYMSATGTTTAYLDATFSGGGSGYYYHRWARVYLKESGTSSYEDYGDVQDDLSEADVAAGRTSECDFYGTISGLDPGTWYDMKIVLCYQAPGERQESSYVVTKSRAFRTKDEYYDIYATLNFYSNGTLYHSQSISDESTSTSDYISNVHFNVTQPTREGFTFGGWAYGNNVYANDGRNEATGNYGSWYASTNVETYRLDAVWNPISHGCDCYIFDSGQWRPATPYIYDGSGWKQASPYIFDGNIWNPPP